MTNTVQAFRNQLQVSVDFSSRISYSGGANLYRSEIILDKGLRQGTFTYTTNVSYDFQNAQAAAMKNRQIVRIVQLIGIPTKVKWTKDSLISSVSGEGDFGTNGVPTYKAQAKTTIPFRFGLAMPLTFQYTNRTAAGPRADVKAQIGFTFDLDKSIGDYYASKFAR